MNKDILRKLQLTQLEILVEIDRICKKHGIVYHLYAGTLLGAVRHGGFIPWDDDIDVCMIRSEYNRFLAIAINELRDEFMLDNYENSFFLNITKIRLKGTFLIEPATLHEKGLNYGIFVDVFPLDNSKPNTIEGTKQMKRLIFLNRVKSVLYPFKVKTEPKSLNKTIRYTLHFFLFPLRIFIKKYFLFTLIDKEAQKFNNALTGYVCELNHGMNPKKYINNSYPLSDINETVYLPFEGHLFPAPKQYGNVLRQHFGTNYMTPIQRINGVGSHFHFVSFDGQSFFNNEGQTVDINQLTKLNK